MTCVMHKVDVLTDLPKLYSLLTRNLWSGWKTSFNDSNLSVCKLPTSTVHVPFKGWMGKTRFKCLWTGYGSRCTSLSVSRTAALLFFYAQRFPVYQEWSTTQTTTSQLATTMESIEVNMGQHRCGKLSTPCRVHAPMNWGCSEGKWVPSPMLERCS